jgi:hypothetical protein
MAAISAVGWSLTGKPLMPTRLFPLLCIALVTASCGGGDKHLPSSNPPEYDPHKAASTTAAPPSAPATVVKPTEFERLKAQLESLEAGQKAKGEGKNVPFDPNLLPRFKGVTNPCEALSRLAPGLSSAQLFAGADGAALKKALGPDADGIARRMDEQLAEGLKHSLGPGAADCPISVRPQKKSGLSQPAHLVLAHTTPTQPFLLAQNSIPDTSLDDYVVDKRSIPATVPPDWVGWKRTDTMARVGKEDRPTKGIREAYEMIIAPKAKRCPDPVGMVDGTFEWSFVMMRATMGPDGLPQGGVLYRRYVTAELKGEVDDEAQLKKVVKFDATVTLQHIGFELPYYSQPHRVLGEFSIDQRTGIPEDLKIITVSGFSEGEAQIKDAQLLGTLTALTAYFSGQQYVKAQSEWNKPNTCVEILFTPATKTKKFVPSESTPVKTELRTKKEQAIVPAKFKEARERPRERNGTVSPREKDSQSNNPATFTYQAPATHTKHSGFWVGAVSRAGVAEALNGEWELADGGLRLRITDRVWTDPNSSHAKAGFAQFDGTVQFDIPLEPYAPNVDDWFSGEIDVVRRMVVRHVGECSGLGSRTEHWRVTARAVPTADSMVVQLAVTTSNDQAAWTCTDELHVSLFRILRSVQMATKTGTTQAFSGRDRRFLEQLSVEVVEGIGDQAGER